MQKFGTNTIYCKCRCFYKCTCFGSTYTKIGTIQRRLAWPLRKDDTQIREAFYIFCDFCDAQLTPRRQRTLWLQPLLSYCSLKVGTTSQRWQSFTLCFDWLIGLIGLIELIGLIGWEVYLKPDSRRTV